jgi:hypothetical protein
MNNFKCEKEKDTLPLSLLKDDHNECCEILCHWKVPVCQTKVVQLLNITTCKISQGRPN